MIKRGRPKGATAYPEHAVCIKCQVFRPKRRGYCDRCRPRNRGAAAKTAANPTTSPLNTTTSAPSPVATASSSSPSAGLAKLVPSEQHQNQDAMVIEQSHAPGVAGQASAVDDNRPTGTSASAGSRGVKRQHHQSAAAPAPVGGQQTAAQIRGKRRRTVSAPVSANNNNTHHHTNGRVAASLMMVSSAMQALERNRNVDVVSAFAAAGATTKDRRPDSSPSYYSTPGSAAHQLALLLPRSDGTAVDVVPLQFLSTASPTATAASSPSPALSSAAASPTSSPSVTSSTHSLMSLANVSALAAARYPSPSPSPSPSSWSSSPPSSPPRAPLHSSSSPYSSPSSSSSSSLSFALPQPRASRAGDLVLPSLGSLALPRPALPRHFFPAHASVTAGLHLASVVGSSSAAPLRLAPN